jgi:hypothetical protein
MLPKQDIQKKKIESIKEKSKTTKRKSVSKSKSPAKTP